MPEMNKQKAKEFEKDLKYGKGLIPTPGGWIAHFWDRHRTRVTELMKDHIQKADRILFVGVGSGDALPRAGLERKTVVGIDLNRNFLMNSTSLCNALVADGTMLPLKDGCMDLVVCNMVLHHIIGQDGLEAALGEYSRVLSTGGSLLAFEPNFFHPSGMALTLLNKFHLYHMAGGGSNYEYALSPFRLSGMCARHFKEVDVKAITFSHPRFPVFMQDLLFRADKHIRWFYHLSFSFMLEAKKQ